MYCSLVIQIFLVFLDVVTVTVIGRICYKLKLIFVVATEVLPLVEPSFNENKIIGDRAVGNSVIFVLGHSESHVFGRTQDLVIALSEVR